jgi:O-antigen ligase
MRINTEYQKSITRQVIDFLFSDNVNSKFSDSLSGQLTGKLYMPWASEAALLLIIFILWYKGLLGQYVPQIEAVWLVPALLIAGAIFTDKSQIKFKKYHFWYLAFLLISAISLMFAAISGIEIVMLVSGWYLSAQFFLALFVAQGSQKKKELLWGIILLSVPAVVYGMYQVAIGVNTSAWFASFESGGTRAFGFFGNPNVFGILAGMLAILVFCLFLEKKKWPLLGLSSFFAIGMGFSLSRSAWLGFLLGLFLALTVYYRKFFWQVILLPIIALFVPKIRERILVAFSNNYLYDSSIDGRIWSLINGKYLFLQKPLLGWGPGSYGGKLALENASPVYLAGIQNGYTALYFTDNQYVQLLVQVGFLGFLTFLLAMISLITSLINRFLGNKNYLALGVLGALCVFLTSGMFANVLEFGAIAVPMAVFVGLAENER